MASGDVSVPGAAALGVLEGRLWMLGVRRCLMGSREKILRRRVKLQVQLHVPIVWGSVTETLRPPTKGPEPKSGDQKHKHSVPWICKAITL